jgi:hypothetical protein
MEKVKGEVYPTKAAFTQWKDDGDLNSLKTQLLTTRHFPHCAEPTPHHPDGVRNSDA